MDIGYWMVRFGISKPRDNQDYILGKIKKYGSRIQSLTKEFDFNLEYSNAVMQIAINTDSEIISYDAVCGSDQIRQDAERAKKKRDKLVKRKEFLEKLLA